MLPARSIPEIAKRRAAERKTFTDAEIIDGFFRIVFGAEFHVSGRVDRIRKYEMPVRVYADSRAKPDRRKQVADVVDDIRSKVAHLDIAMVDSRKDANVTVTLVRDRDIEKTIREFYGASRRERSSAIARAAMSVRLPQGRIVPHPAFRRDHRGRCRRVHLPRLRLRGIAAGARPDQRRRQLPWTMFNDEVQKGFFDVYDQYLLNILYDPRIRAGMTSDRSRKCCRRYCRTSAPRRESEWVKGVTLSVTPLAVEGAERSEPGKGWLACADPTTSLRSVDRACA